MKIHAIIQARTGSTRLPSKVLKNLNGKTVLAHVIERIKQSKFIDKIIIATTDCENDQLIIDESVKNYTSYFRGSESDVLSRYYHAAKEYGSDIIVRITSDCPLIDPCILDEMLEFYKNNKYDIVTNAGNDIKNRTYPRGLDIEIFSFTSLKEAFKTAREGYQREHVTPYIYENSISVYYYKSDIDYSNHRWTLDTEEDLKLISLIYDNLYKQKHNFYLKEIIEFINDNPELQKINAHIEQKKLKKMNKILIFTEAGTQIGLGHLTRCCALYDAAIKLGYDCELIIYSDLNSISFMDGRKHEIVDWKNEKYIESKINSSFYCIIDSYLASYDIYELITKNFRECIYIDDVARIDYPKKGIVVNPSLYFDLLQYNTKKSFMGKRYIILRDEFQKNINKSINKEVTQVMITMGGSDVCNLTPKVLDIVSSRFKNARKIIVLGTDSGNIKQINKLIDDNTQIVTKANASKMKEMMVSSDFVITTAGQTIYELIKTKTPFIPIKIIDNQENNITGLRNLFGDDVSINEFFKNANNFNDDYDFSQIIDYDFRKKMSCMFEELLEESGAKNIISLFENN